MLTSSQYKRYASSRSSSKPPPDRIYALALMARVSYWRRANVGSIMYVHYHLRSSKLNLTSPESRRRNCVKLLRAVSVHIKNRYCDWLTACGINGAASVIGLSRVLGYSRVLDSINYSSIVLVLEYSFNSTPGRKFQFPVPAFQINEQLLEFCATKAPSPSSCDLRVASFAT